MLDLIGVLTSAASEPDVLALIRAERELGTGVLVDNPYRLSKALANELLGMRCPAG